MRRVTLSSVNKALDEAGIDAQLLRGKGYFYFSGTAVDNAQEQGVYGVYRLSDLTVEQWVDCAREKMPKD